MYSYFSNIYEVLMKDFDYSKFYKFVIDNSNTKYIVDIGCGSGSLLKLLEKDNFTGIGLDYSEDMLSLAHTKCNNYKFMKYDMRNKFNLKNLDLVTCFVDSVNYLTKKEDVISFFKNVYESLNDDGVFLLDFHTKKKINEVFIGHYENHKINNILFEWEVSKTNNENECQHNLFFHIENQVFQEKHLQKTFENEYISMLEEIGFSVDIDKLSDELRIFIKAYKKK